MNYSSWNLIKDIFNLIKPYRARFWLASLSRIIGDVAWLYPAFAFASIVTFLTKYTPGEPLMPVWTVLGLWALATIIRSGSQLITKLIGYKIAEKLDIDFNLKSIKHLFQLDMAWHERENSGNKIKRIQNAGDGVKKIVRFWFNNLLEIGVNLVAINIIIAQFDLLVLIVLLIFLVTYFMIARSLAKKAGDASYQVNIEEEGVNGLLFEVINNIRTVKVMSMAKTLYLGLISKTNELFNRIGIRIYWYQTRNFALTFWSGMFRIGIIFLIIKGILNGNYDLGFLIVFNMYFGDLRSAIDELAEVSIEFVTSKLSVARGMTILEEPVKIEDNQDKISFPVNWEKIIFNNVSFAYGSDNVLKNISFEVCRGEKVGIVGLSGAGKSTLFKLLLKEREEFAGEILFDDLSIKQIKNEDYFNHVSVVLQDTEVFNFSLKDNITITHGTQKENESLLRQSLEVAHLTELVGKLPDGLNTLIGEKGVKLSGGERQRLGIARAIFKRPEILLLDEATSHLDLESEEKIRDTLHSFFENVTAIVIAHRLTTIKEMDKILVIEDGKIIESGNFESLYNSRGRFYELWEKQGL